MAHRFGRHAANEVLAQARTFLQHVEDDDVWPSMHEPVRGRMRPADAQTGRDLLAAATQASSQSKAHAGDTHDPTHALDDAASAVSHWLADQLTHARGELHERGNEAALEALNAALTHGHGRPALAADARAYIALARRDDDTGHAVAASYADARSRTAILADGEHLADALDAQLGAPGAALGSRAGTTATKDAAVDALARWLHRWTLVAHRVVGAPGLAKLGLDHARHHPAHRGKHPAATPAAPATTPT